MPGNPSHALFSRLFRENRDKVFRFAYKLTEDEARADDITQQCFIRLWESIDTVREQEDIFPLLFVLVKRLVIDDTRRLYREKKRWPCSGKRRKNRRRTITSSIRSS